MAWGALISVSNKGQLGLKAEQSEYAEEEKFAAGEDVGDSDTSEDEEDDYGAITAQREGLVKTASKLSMCEEGAPRTHWI